jgi:hypothetical protein
MSVARVLAVLLGCLPTILAGPASAATLLVAPNGVDSGSCGAKVAPCRTITRAIANAGVDDTVLVAPGRYGDADGSHVISGPQDETPNLNGCGCVLDIAKRVTVIARDGAAATIIDGGRAGFDTVRLSADGAVFGKKNKGFTLTGAESGDVALRLTANGATITGHVFADNDNVAMIVTGSRNLIASSRFLPGAVDNVLVTGADNVITETASTGASNAGFNIGGNRNVLRGVFATANAIGVGFAGTGHVVSGSVVIRNSVAGIDVAGAAASAVITKSTIHSNGGTLLENCGLSVSSMTGSAVATGNYWGAPTGPGPDPADDVCVSIGGVATSTPFATKEHKTPTKPLR